MKCSIIVPSVESVLSAFDGCLPSFIAHEGNEHEVILVDDGSPPAVQARAREQCARHGFRFLANRDNVGYPGAVNRGIQVAQGDLIILVNTDVRFTQPVTGCMRALLSGPSRVGLLGGLLLYPDQRVQHGGIVRQGRRFAHRGHQRHPEEVPEVHRPRYLIGCTGALLGIRRAMIDEIGTLDERLSQACDDIEYGLRAWSNGWEVYYSPEIRAEHQEGGTRGNTLPSKLRRSVPWLLRELMTNNRFRRIRKQFDLPAIEARVARANLRLDRGASQV